MIHTLREIRPDDLPEISALAIASKATWGYGEEAMRVFTEELTVAERTLESLLCAEVAFDREGAMLGYFTLMRLDGGGVELEHLFVAPSRLRRGIGSLLLQESMLRAREFGASSLKLIADPNSEGFYARHGAVAVGMHASSIPGRSIPIMEIPL